MTRPEAVKKLHAMYGQKGYAEVGARISSQDDRDAKLARLRELRAEKDAIDQWIKDELAKLPWYVEAVARRRAIYLEIQKGDHLPYYKFTIGLNKEWCREIIGYGDTWEQAFAMADKRKAGHL